MTLAQRDRWLALALLAVSALYYLAYFDCDLNPSDEGYLVYGVVRVLDGQLPGADFHAYEPGRYWLLAPFFASFGADVVVERAVLLVHRVVIVLLVFAVARRHLSPAAALVPTLATLVLPGPWHKSWFPLFLLAGMWLTDRYLERPSRRLLAAGGLVAGLALVFRLDLGAFSALLWGLALLATWAGPVDLLRRAALVVATAAVPLAPAAWCYAADGKLLDALHFYLAEYTNASGQLDRIHPKIAGFPDPVAAIARFPVGFFEVVVWLSLASAAVLAVAVALRWRREGRPPWRLVLLGLAWACSFLAVAVQPDREHVLQNGPPLYLVGVVAALSLEGELRRRPRLRLAPALVAAVLAALVAESLFVPGINGYSTGSIRMRFGPLVPAGLPHASVRLAPWVAAEYRGLLAAIAARSRPGDGLATCFCLPMLNVLAERPNPTGLDILFPHTIARADQQERYLSALAGVRLFVANTCELEHRRPPHCPPSDHTLEDFAPAVVEQLRRDWRPVFTSANGFATVYARRGDDGG